MHNSIAFNNQMTGLDSKILCFFIPATGMSERLEFKWGNMLKPRTRSELIIGAQLGFLGKLMQRGKSIDELTAQRRCEWS